MGMGYNLAKNQGIAAMIVNGKIVHAVIPVFYRYNNESSFFRKGIEVGIHFVTIDTACAVPGPGRKRG